LSSEEDASAETERAKTERAETEKAEAEKAEAEKAKAEAEKAEAEKAGDTKAKVEAEKADDTLPPADFASWTPEQIEAWGKAQKIGSDNSNDRTLVCRQMHIAVVLILGGAAIAVIGLLAIKEDDSTKLTAIVAIGTAVIGSGAALLPTGAAAGAAARILTRNEER
jgi:hypothetical protein